MYVYMEISIFGYGIPPSQPKTFPPWILDKGIFLNKLGHPEGTTNKKLVEMVAVLAVVLPFRQDNRTAAVAASSSISPFLYYLIKAHEKLNTNTWHVRQVDGQKIERGKANGGKPEAVKSI